VNKLLTNGHFGILRIARPILVAFLCSPSFSQNYYPLAPGNRWDYIKQYSDLYGSSVDTFSVHVAGKQILPNGKEYYQIHPQHDIAFTGQFVRADSVGIHYYWEADSTDVLVYKVNAGLGESWTTPFGLSIQLTDIDTLVLFGVQTRVLTFSTSFPVAYDVSFSDVFGPISYFSPDEPPGTSYTSVDAAGCIIGSSTYGQLLVNIQSIDEVPTSFTLFQNHPNPFNSATHISFDASIQGLVQIRIFNHLGQEVAVLDHQSQPGRNSVPWKAGHLSSGVYFYRLESGSLSQVRKMILIK